MARCFNAMGDEGIGGYLGDAEQMPIVTSPTSPVAPRDAEGEERSSDALPTDGWCWLLLVGGFFKIFR